MEIKIHKEAYKKNRKEKMEPSLKMSIIINIENFNNSFLFGTQVLSVV